MYKRLSSHLPSLDLDFNDIPDALRETATRVETAIQHARATHDVTAAWGASAGTTAPDPEGGAASASSTNVASNAASGVSKVDGVAPCTSIVVGDTGDLGDADEGSEGGTKTGAKTNVNSSFEGSCETVAVASYSSQPSRSKSNITEESASPTAAKYSRNKELSKKDEEENGENSDREKEEVDPDDEFDCLM